MTEAEGDLYVYSDDDIGRIVAELYARVRELEGVDETTADCIAAMTHDLATGDWNSDDI
jgi:hypothetical protein